MKTYLFYIYIFNLCTINLNNRFGKFKFLTLKVKKLYGISRERGLTFPRQYGTTQIT